MHFACKPLNPDVVKSVGSALSTAEIRDQHSRQLPKSKQVGDGALRKYIYRESVRLEGAGYGREV